VKVIGVNGSGRIDGNTAVLVKGFLDGAAGAGAETELIQLATWSLRGCSACKRCKVTHRCVIRDDMQQFYDVAAGTDVLLLASPVYLDHITAQLMSFIQRTYCYLGLALENCWPRRGVRAAVGVTYGAGDPHQYDDVNDWMEARLRFYFGIPTVAKFVVPLTSHDRIIDPTHPEVARAREVGRRLVYQRRENPT
jgi:multimeric flavodoxin WrbA